MLYKLLRLNPNFFTLIGGALISVSVNVYTGVATAVPRSPVYVSMMLAAAFVFVSGMLFAVFALKLGSVHQLAYQDTPDWLQSDETWARLVKPKLLSLCLLFVFAVILSASGLFILHNGFGVEEFGEHPTDRSLEDAAGGMKTDDTQVDVPGKETEVFFPVPPNHPRTDNCMESAEVGSEEAMKDSPAQKVMATDTL